MRPGLDLLARVPDLPSVRRAVDLGCGTGELTALLASRFPSARVTGLDSSEEMLARARARHAGIEFVRGDIAEFAEAAATAKAQPPEEPLDLLFSNAALHWVPDHAALLPKLCAGIARGGALCVQVPHNFNEPSHTLLREICAMREFRSRVRLPEPPVLPPERYYDLLAPLSRDVDLWETVYLHVLEGEDPVLEWVKGTALLPVTEALAGDPEAQDRFLAAYRRRLREAYPKRKDGKTAFPFRRLFFVARF